MGIGESAASLKLVIFDWAGTTVDHGCFAPIVPFMETLKRLDLEISVADARGPMGLQKRDHLQALFELPSITAQWQKKHGRPWTKEDVNRAYEEHFVPLQLESVKKCSQLMPGLLDCVGFLRERGIKIGTTTGYFEEAAQLAYEAAAEQGYAPDFKVSATQVPTGRPAPWMIFRNMEALNVYPASSVLKVGDTVPDIDEGRNAGTWTVGVTHTGSEVGLRQADWEALPADEKQQYAEIAAAKLKQAGAHEILGSVAELPTFLPQLQERLQRGEKP